MLCLACLDREGAAVLGVVRRLRVYLVGFVRGVAGCTCSERRSMLYSLSQVVLPACSHGSMGLGVVVVICLLCRFVDGRLNFCCCGWTVVEMRLRTA